jgi:hypothetical protein
MPLIIGVDFDNTLTSYDDLMHSIAIQHGLIPPDTPKSKKEIRDTIRQLPNGEIRWQQLQAIAYGPRMGEARLIDGVKRFFELCQQHPIKVYIISHKTEFANLDETGTNLRLAALDWMTRNGFFDNDGLGISREDVYFESTRRKKIQRIEQLQCTHVIDDLEETFLEDSFPTHVEKILYAPRPRHLSLPGVRIVSTWREICEYFFDTEN